MEYINIIMHFNNIRFTVLNIPEKNVSLLIHPYRPLLYKLK